MIPTKVVELAGVNAIAINAAIFNPAPGSEQKIMLFKNDIVPTRNTLLADLTIPAFEGYTPLSCGAGAPGIGVNPVTGAFEIRLVEPLGGFEWATGGDDLPETIYGFAVTNSAGTTLIAAERFAVPILLNTGGLVFDVHQPKVTIPMGYMS